MVKLIWGGNLAHCDILSLLERIASLSYGEFYFSDYNRDMKAYVRIPYDKLVLDFRYDKDNLKESYSNDDYLEEEFSEVEPRKGYYTREEINNWRRTQRVVLSPIKVYSVKYYKSDECLIIEVETDNEHELRKLFYLCKDLADPGHSWGCEVYLTEDRKGFLEDFGMDGDGGDSIEEVN